MSYHFISKPPCRLPTSLLLMEVTNDYYHVNSFNSLVFCLRRSRSAGRRRRGEGESGGRSGGEFSRTGTQESRGTEREKKETGRGERGDETKNTRKGSHPSILPLFRPLSFLPSFLFPSPSFLLSFHSIPPPIKPSRPPPFFFLLSLLSSFLHAYLAASFFPCFFDSSFSIFLCSCFSISFICNSFSSFLGFSLFLSALLFCSAHFLFKSINYLISLFCPAYLPFRCRKYRNRYSLNLELEVTHAVNLRFGTSGHY